MIATLSSWELTALIATSVMVIGATAKVIKDWETICAWFKKCREAKKVRFAKSQQPYCSLVCSAPNAMVEILKQLNEMFTFIQVSREISLETHGMALIDKCKLSIEKEYMEQADKDDLIHSFIPYLIGNGNGKVFYYVQMAMNLPVHKNGSPCDVDLLEIVTREQDKFKKRESNVKP